MAEPSVFRNAIDFLAELGIYDVVLPFLLIFAIVFAVLEKTKIFGTEKVEGVEYTRKNVNAIVAFVAALLVVASAKMVAAINITVARLLIILVLAIMFLLLYGTFFGEKQDLFEDLKSKRGLFFIIMFAGVILIFLDSLTRSDGKSYLRYFYEQVRYNFTSTTVATIIFLLIILSFIFWLVKSPAPKKPASHEESH